MVLVIIATKCFQLLLLLLISLVRSYAREIDKCRAVEPYTYADKLLMVGDYGSSSVSLFRYLMLQYAREG
jgi:hypothetical protein